MLWLIYIVDRWAASLGLVSCTPDRCNLPSRACPPQSQRQGRMYVEASLRRTCFGIFAYDVPNANHNRLVRIDLDRWCPLVYDSSDRCNILGKIAREFRLALA